MQIFSQYSVLNASANNARLFPAASHALGMLDLPLRFRRFRYKDRLFGYHSITERNVSRRDDRACLARDELYPQAPDCAEEVDSRARRSIGHSFRLFRLHHGTKHAHLRAGYFCAPVFVDGRISLRIYASMKKKAHPPRICAWGSSTECASSRTLTSRELFASHASRGADKLTEIHEAVTSAKICSI